MLNRTMAHGGPWWFVQLWLTIHTNTMVDRPPLSDSVFPKDFTDNEEPAYRKCMSFGEAASVYPGSDQSAKEMSEWFSQFYTVSSSAKMEMFVYSADAEFELPADLNLEAINDEIDSRELFMISISPCILPVGIFQGRSTSLSYEFYNPITAARQFGLGQLPIGLYFHQLLENKGTVPLALLMSKVLSIKIPTLGDCDQLNLNIFMHTSFQTWWREWASHIFHQSAKFYLTELISNISPQVPDAPIPSTSASGQRISYAMVLAPSGNSVLESTIGLTAPKVTSLLQEPIVKETFKRKKPAKEKVQTSSKKAKLDDPADTAVLDPSIEEFLDEQVLEEEIDEAAAEIAEEQTTSATAVMELSAKQSQDPSADIPADTPSAIIITEPSVDVPPTTTQPKRTKQAIRKVNINPLSCLQVFISSLS